MIKRLVAGGAVLATGAAIWGVAGQDNTKRDSTGQIVQSGQLGAFVTKIGDCFAGSEAGSTTVSTVDGVPCSNPHHWQVYFKTTTSQATYDMTAVHKDADQQCSNYLQTLVNGLTTEKINEYSNADFKTLEPTSASWDKGDRGIDCLIGSNSSTFSDSFIS